jgi:hypothetical protein
MHKTLLCRRTSRAVLDLEPAFVGLSPGLRKLALFLCTLAIGPPAFVFNADTIVKLSQTSSIRQHSVQNPSEKIRTTKSGNEKQRPPVCKPNKTAARCRTPVRKDKMGKEKNRPSDQG